MNKNDLCLILPVCAEGLFNIHVCAISDCIYIILRLSGFRISLYDRELPMTNDEGGKWRDLGQSGQTVCSLETKVTDCSRQL
jgi:hypothetical protein